MTVGSLDRFAKRRELHVCIVVDPHRVGHWLVDRKDFPRKRLRPSDGRGHGHLRRCGGWDARAILQHWGIRRNYEYDDCNYGRSFSSNTACELRERPRSICATALINANGEGLCFLHREALTRTKQRALSQVTLVEHLETLR